MQSNPVMVSLYCICIQSSTRQISVLSTAGALADVVGSLQWHKQESIICATRRRLSHVPEQALEEHRDEVLISCVHIGLILSIRLLIPTRDHSYGPALIDDPIHPPPAPQPSAQTVALDQPAMAVLRKSSTVGGDGAGSCHQHWTTTRSRCCSGVRVSSQGPRGSRTIATRRCRGCVRLCENQPVGDIRASPHCQSPPQRRGPVASPAAGEVDAEADGRSVFSSFGGDDVTVISPFSFSETAWSHVHRTAAETQSYPGCSSSCSYGLQVCSRYQAATRESGTRGRRRGRRRQYDFWRGC